MLKLCQFFVPRNAWRGPLVRWRAANYRGSPAVLRVALIAAGRPSFVLALVASGALARKLEEFAWLSMVQLFRLLGAGLVPARFANALPSGRECVVQRICPWLAKGSRGKLALVARNQALLHQPPNPSIERTPSGMLRMPTVAAHVQR